MDSTAQEIRQQEQQSTTNNTPEPADEVGGDDGGSDGGGSGLPVPSVDKKIVAVIAIVAIAAIAWKLKQRSSSSSGGGGLAEAREQLDKTDRAKATPDEDTAAEGRIEVPQDPSQPLAGDDAVIEEFRERGILSDRSEQ